jgi:hypothetical protein
MTVSCVVALPTRNRSMLAKNAIRSVLNPPCDNVRLLVSDNSTDPGHASHLMSFCRRLNHPRLLYVRPPEPLAMAPHWEFAVAQAEAQANTTHVAILTDRMAFRDGMLKRVLDHVAERPDAVLSYNDDLIHDRSAPVRLERKPLSGRLLELDCAHLLYLSSIGVFPQALPRMLNCVVPLDVLRAIRKRFGDVYTSVAPDLCHAYRCLAIHDRIRYLDAPVMVQYGFRHSNGTGYYSGKLNDAWADFNRNAGSRGLTFAAPIPAVCCNLNIVYHEYCLARQQAREVKFPPVHWVRYVHAIANDLHLCENTEVRERLFVILREHAGEELAGWVPPVPPKRAPDRISERFERIVWRTGGLLTAPLRLALSGLGFGPSEEVRHTFANVRAALAYSNRTAPTFVANPDHLVYMRSGWKLAG